MTDCTQNNLHIAEKFVLEGEILSIEPYGNGHINSTFLLVTEKKRYILQKMNTTIFKDSDALMKNICLVTEHLRKKGIETLEVIFTKDGDSYLKNEEGAYRVYAFIENTVAYDKVDDASIFKASGKAFGEFQQQLGHVAAGQIRYHGFGAGAHHNSSFGIFLKPIIANAQDIVYRKNKKLWEVCGCGSVAE